MFSEDRTICFPCYLAVPCSHILNFKHAYVVTFTDVVAAFSPFGMAAGMGSGAGGCSGPFCTVMAASSGSTGSAITSSGISDTKMSAMLKCFTINILQVFVYTHYNGSVSACLLPLGSIPCRAIANMESCALKLS